MDDKHILVVVRVRILRRIEAARHHGISVNDEYLVMHQARIAIPTDIDARVMELAILIVGIMLALLHHPTDLDAILVLLHQRIADTVMGKGEGEEINRVLRRMDSMEHGIGAPVFWTEEILGGSLANGGAGMRGGTTPRKFPCQELFEFRF